MRDRTGRLTDPLDRCLEVIGLQDGEPGDRQRRSEEGPRLDPHPRGVRIAHLDGVPGSADEGAGRAEFVVAGVRGLFAVICQLVVSGL
ncbi:hypothetical protein A5684_12350 [Mycobacterium intracellulare]|nr:hypothetical protein A5684_12350 [Mycobacterium intracellulare]